MLLCCCCCCVADVVVLLMLWSRSRSSGYFVDLVLLLFCLGFCQKNAKKFNVIRCLINFPDISIKLLIKY